MVKPTPRAGQLALEPGIKAVPEADLVARAPLKLLRGSPPRASVAPRAPGTIALLSPARRPRGTSAFCNIETTAHTNYRNRGAVSRAQTMDAPLLSPTGVNALRESFGDQKPPDITRKITTCVACRKQKVSNATCAMASLPARDARNEVSKRGLPCTVNRSLQTLLEEDATSWKRVELHQFASCAFKLGTIPFEPGGTIVRSRSSANYLSFGHLFNVCYDEYKNLVALQTFAQNANEEDALIGNAVRLASDINLHSGIYKVLKGDREGYLQARLYYLVYVCDHHFSIAYGRPPMSQEGFIIDSASRLLETKNATEEDARLISQVKEWSLLGQVFDSFGVDVDTPVPLQTLP
ncbi:hypothetical protein N7486_000615 [Penicillium sp. IBT 16267x]|nr:hypothetical protein N7486_000615 [Penicillium sp. IBT 16267x]